MMKVKSKVWLDNKGSLSFGPGRAKMLSAISKAGSINSAAEELGMSYRHVWSYINVAEKRLGKKLLLRKRGGSNGGGAELTEYAIGLIRKYEKLEREVAQYVEKRYQVIFKD